MPDAVIHSEHRLTTTVNGLRIEPTGQDGKLLQLDPTHLARLGLRVLTPKS